MRRLLNFHTISIALLSVIFLVMFCLMPKLQDDEWFDCFNILFREDGSFPSFLTGVTENIRYRLAVDNGRLPNLICTPLMLVPKWILSIFFAGCTALTLVEGAKLIGVWRRAMLGFSIWVTGFLYLLPWYDNITTVNYALNYIPSALLTVVLARALLGQISMRILPLFFLAVLTGWCHEANSCALLGGIIGLVIVFGEFRTKRTLVAAAGLLMPLIFYMLIPAYLHRMESEVCLTDFFHLMSGIFQGVWFYAFAALLLLLILIPKTRVKVLTPTFALIFGSALGACAIWRLQAWNIRGSWMMLQFTALGFALLASSFTRGRAGWRALAVVLVSVAVVQHILCLPWYAKLYCEYNTAWRLVRENPGRDKIFGPVTSPLEVPPYTLARPNFNAYNISGFPFHKVIPQELADFEPSKAEEIGVGGRAWLYRGFIVIPDRELRADHWLSDVCYDGQPVSAYTCATHFETPAGRFVYVLPTFSYRRLLTGTLTGFRFTGEELPPDETKIIVERLKTMQ